VTGVVVKDEGVFTFLADFSVFVALVTVVDSTGLSARVRVFRINYSISRGDFLFTLAVDSDKRLLALFAAEVVVTFLASFSTFVADFVSGEVLVSAVFNACVDFQEFTGVAVGTGVEVVFLASSAGLVGTFDAGLAGGDVAYGAFGGTGGTVD